MVQSGASLPRLCTNFPTPVSAAAHCPHNVPPGNIKLSEVELGKMEDPEDLPSLFSQPETIFFDSGQESYPSQKVRVATIRQAKILHREHI